VCCLQDVTLASFIEEEVPAALRRAAKLRRSHLAPSGAAQACSAVFCCVGEAQPTRIEGVRADYRVHAGPGVFSESEAVIKVAKGALKQLETIAFGGGSGLAAWLVARCCRVRCCTALFLLVSALYLKNKFEI
jgi:hypothetical protein